MPFAVAKLLTLGRRLDELSSPCQDRVIPECGLEKEEAMRTGEAEWPEAGR